jgi:homoserine kinase
VNRRRLVRVPASSANLGPGFDSFAAAVGIHMTLEVEETGRFAVETDLQIARDRRNLAVRGFARLHGPDRFTFRISSDIPLSGGLGSSAAAYVAGLMAADHAFELDADLLTLATELEGHPDNVAAALQGGFVVCADGSAHRFEAPDGLEAVLVVPHAAVRTKQARAALPAEVPMGDAVFNTAHGALLMLGLAKGDWELVAAGLDDRLHQPRREHLYPRSMDLVRRARDLGALGATISGAGPTVLVWCHYEQTAGVVEALGREAAGWADVLRAPFESRGADVREL